MIERTRDIGKLTGTMPDSVPPSDAAALDETGLETASKALRGELSTLNEDLLTKSNMTFGEAVKVRELIERTDRLLFAHIELFLKEVNFKRLDNGGAAVTLPIGMTIQEIGSKANEICKKLGLRRIFFQDNSEGWQRVESDPSTQTVPGRVYRITVEEQLDNRSKNVQKETLTQNGRELAPIGALAVATICVYLVTKGRENFLRNLLIRASAPGVSLTAFPEGVGIRYKTDDPGVPSIGCASSVKAEE